MKTNSDWVHYSCGKRHDPGTPCPSTHPLGNQEANHEN